MQKETRNCQNCKKSFEIDGSDFAFYAKMEVPPPTWCPDCRMIRRMAFWNQRNLFRKKDIDGKTLFSTYPEESYFKIIDRDVWWSDEFEALDYGRDYDFSRPFFEQLKELVATVPHPSRNIVNSVNSDYCHTAENLKDCYLCFDIINCEDCLYSVDGEGAKDSIDTTSTGQLESCYEIFVSGVNYRLFYSHRSRGSRESYFLNHSWFCNNCFGCVNLYQKEYHIFNEPYEKEEYFKKLKEFNLGSYSSVQKIKAQFNEFALRFPYPYMNYGRNEGEDLSGDNLFVCKNTRDSFSVGSVENGRYLQSVVQAVDCYDCTASATKLELTYEAVNAYSGTHNLKYCLNCISGCQDLEYSINCFASENCFGCVGLKKKKYCIFNKQYSKEEYFALKAKIIEQMKAMPYKDKLGRIYGYGEFFPPDMAPFAANESGLPDWTGMDKERAFVFGLSWREVPEKEYKVDIKASDIPDHINDVTDRITDQLISCSDCKKAYRILPKELAFYRRLIIPLPRLCPDCRFSERTKQRNRPKLYDRACECAGETSANKVYKNVGAHFHGSSPCPIKFKTAYEVGNPKIIYCVKCYEKEIR